MGTYLNHDAIHSVNPVAAGSVLSHDHVDADMHTPVVYGDWHTVQEASHRKLSLSKCLRVAWNCSIWVSL